MRQEDPATSEDAFELQVVQRLIVEHPKRQRASLDLPLDGGKPLIDRSNLGLGGRYGHGTTVQSR